MAKSLGMYYEERMSTDSPSDHSLRLDSAMFSEPGLYLLFEGGKRLDLTRKLIGEITERFLSDPELIPNAVKEAAAYAACQICPERHRARICHAILPTLPFVEHMEEYLSYNEVTAVFLPETGMPLEIRQTDMQQALIFISILSLIEYCEVGHKFQKHFRGVSPLQPADRIAERIFLNMYSDFSGDLDAVAARVEKMEKELRVTASCQIDRLKLISKSDAFLNAFVNTQSTASWLLFEVEKQVDKAQN